MTDWKLMMLLILPLMAVGPKLRTWAALMGTAVAAMLLPPVSVAAYIIIDSVAGAIVLRHPSGWVQKLIGALFATMVMFHIGFIYADNIGAAENYVWWNTTIGWVQWAALASWGAYDAARYAVRRVGPRVRLLVARKGL